VSRHPIHRSHIAASIVACLSLAAAAVHAGPAEGETRTSYKLSFGPGGDEPGYTRVLADTVYEKERGYGFEPGSKVKEVERAAAGGPYGGFVTGEQPFYFSLAVPEGNYKVTVALGDPAGESDTTVKAELRRLMLEEVKTVAGKVESLSFVVNVRTPNYPGGKVHLKAPRETTAEAWAWDERITLEFNGSRPCLCALTVEKVDVSTVYILGDSTVCDQSAEPYASWGQMLPRFLKPDVAVANHAESGETLHSSAGAKRLDKVLSQMKSGDYLLIQYGHNDMKDKTPDAPQSYKAALRQWVQKVRQKGGTPVLITPMNRHRFDGNTVTNSLKEYPDMVREAAKEEGVTLIDLNAMSKTLYEALGSEPSIQLFEHAGDSKKFDATHHSPYGAYELAKCVIEGIRQSRLDLASHIADGVPVFDPAKPDTAADFKVPPSPVFTKQRPLGD
jgi:lysophospholipase L1-like esterase